MPKQSSLHIPPSSNRLPVLLLGGLSLLLLAVWMLPPGAKQWLDIAWFPVALHTIAESFAVAVAILVFAVTWHAYRPERPANLIVLACGFLAVGLLDFAHTLSYLGMPTFVTPASVEKAIDFWLAARLVAAATLLVIAFRPWQPLAAANSRYLLLAAALLLVAGVYILQLGFPHLWPRTFIAGSGLTPFKVAMEWLIIALLVVAALRFNRLQSEEQPYDAQGMLVAVLLSILSELCFTAYSNVHDLFSLLGHVYKVIAYCFIYRVVFISSVRAPYERLSIEIAEREAAEQRVEVLAFYDGLTGLPNLTLLQDRTEQALTASARDRNHVALLYLDLDRFKLINDSLGHSCGDNLLRGVAGRLQCCVHSTDTICRPGGDKFVILLTDMDDTEEIAAVPEAIAAQLTLPFSVLGQNISISATIGIAVAPSDGQDFETLRRNAETAMYKAKGAGGRAWCFYDSTMNDEMVERLNLINGLRHALERRQLLLHYQLQFDLHSGRVVGAEALVRWQHPEWGLVLPMRFIPVAEESQLIIPIGEWVIHQACHQAMAWRREGLPIPRIAVNLSPLQLHKGNIEQVVIAALAASGLPASALELERTESSLIDDTEQVLITMQRLKTLGVMLSIDDFGTGYSSLAYLRRLAVDKLKIDQSFIRDLLNSSDGITLVTAILHMAQSLGLKTLAEGVEDERTADELRRLGCAEVQGYLYAKPLPANEVTAVLQARAQAPDLAHPPSSRA